MKDQIVPPPADTSNFRAAQLRDAYRALEDHSSQAITLLTPLAESGSPLAMLYLGHALRFGIGVPPDVHSAEMWYRRAEGAGAARARYKLGRLYLDTGRYEDARMEFERESSRGFAPADHMLGRIYYFGYGVPVDKGRARTLLEAASRKGVIFAKALLAHDKMHAGGLFAAMKGAFELITCGIDILRTVWTEGDSSDRLC